MPKQQMLVRLLGVAGFFLATADQVEAEKDPRQLSNTLVMSSGTLNNGANPNAGGTAVTVAPLVVQPAPAPPPVVQPLSMGTTTAQAPVAPAPVVQPTGSPHSGSDSFVYETIPRYVKLKYKLIQWFEDQKQCPLQTNGEFPAWIGWKEVTAASPAVTTPQLHVAGNRTVEVDGFCPNLRSEDFECKKTASEIKAHAKSSVVTIKMDTLTCTMSDITLYKMADGFTGVRLDFGSCSGHSALGATKPHVPATASMNMGLTEYDSTYQSTDFTAFFKAVCAGGPAATFYTSVLPTFINSFNATAKPTCFSQTADTAHVIGKGCYPDFVFFNLQDANGKVAMIPAKDMASLTAMIPGTQTWVHHHAVPAPAAPAAGLKYTRKQVVAQSVPAPAAPAPAPAPIGAIDIPVGTGLKALPPRKLDSATCATFDCPAPLTLRFQPDRLTCASGGCTKDKCCLMPADDPCAPVAPGTTLSPDDPCAPVAPVKPATPCDTTTPRPVPCDTTTPKPDTCEDFVCTDPMKLRPQPERLTCFGGPCTAATCCLLPNPDCGDFVCIPPMKLRPQPERLHCNHKQCTAQTCCLVPTTIAPTMPPTTTTTPIPEVPGVVIMDRICLYFRGCGGCDNNCTCTPPVQEQSGATTTTMTTLTPPNPVCIDYPWENLIIGLLGLALTKAIVSYIFFACIRPAAKIESKTTNDWHQQAQTGMMTSIGGAYHPEFSANMSGDTPMESRIIENKTEYSFYTTAGLGFIVSGIVSFLAVHGIYFIWRFLLAAIGVENDGVWNSIDIFVCPFSLWGVWIAIWLTVWVTLSWLWGWEFQIKRHTETRMAVVAGYMEESSGGGVCTVQ